MSARADEPRADGEAPQFGLAKSLVFSVVLIALFFGAIELGLRGWVFFFREGYERFDLATQTFDLVPGEHRSGIRVNAQGFMGPDLLPDGPDLYRIYALGDSCTFGAGEPLETYPAYLQARLADVSDTGLRYDVVNAGVQGLNSELALNRLRAKAPLVKPRVVTIYIGWNDLMKFDPSAQAASTRWSGVALALDRLWVVKGLRKLVFFHLRPMLSPPRAGPASHTGRFRDFQPAIYEANLREILRAVRELGARPLLLTLPTVVREEMTVDDLKANGVMFPYFPGANAVGDFLALLDAYNRTIRRVAVEEQVPLLDLAQIFGGMADVRRLFYDTMHPTTDGRQIIADALKDILLRERLLVPPAAS